MLLWWFVALERTIFSPLVQVLDDVIDHFNANRIEAAMSFAEWNQLQHVSKSDIVDVHKNSSGN